MAYVITKKCVGTCDTACVDVCPTDCIVGPIPLDQLRAVPAAERGRAFPQVQMFIDPDECIDCGACIAECPVAAIHHEDDMPDDCREDVARNAACFENLRAIGKR
jgi:ferredoxin